MREDGRREPSAKKCKVGLHKRTVRARETMLRSSRTCPCFICVVHVAAPFVSFAPLASFALFASFASFGATQRAARGASSRQIEQTDARGVGLRGCAGSSVGPALPSAEVVHGRTSASGFLTGFER